MLWQRLKASTSLSVALALVLVLAASTFCSAATISYGNFGPVNGVMFNDVEESSSTDDTPLYGPPETFPTGLDFDPQEFGSHSGGGSEDITDGQLNYTIMTTQGGMPIASITLFEAGDYSLTGSGTNQTQVLAGAIMRATVTQIDGVSVAPVDLPPVSDFFMDDLSGGVAFLQPWSVDLALAVPGQVTSGGRTGRPTKIEVVINNQLQSFSEPSSQAIIAKKEFRIMTNLIPEPSTFALVGIALCGCGLFARRERN
jgi:PEP-CTERM motif